MNTTEQNKTIDTFMESKGEYISYKDQGGGECWGEYKPNKYHSDWGLLMYVVDKIEKLHIQAIVTISTSLKAGESYVTISVGNFITQQGENCKPSFNKTIFSIF